MQVLQTRKDLSMVIPTFHYEDAHAALDFLEKAFGFERHAVYEGDGGIVVHAEVKAAGGWLMLGSSRPDSPYDSGRQSVYVVIDGDVDGHCERARERVRRCSASRRIRTTVAGTTPAATRRATSGASARMRRTSDDG